MLDNCKIEVGITFGSKLKQDLPKVDLNPNKIFIGSIKKNITT
jgi:hypothetical protein